ncbi:MAG: CdvA-like protein [Candidatus Bathyarchaeota archaeon]|nr:CdvA-like protein [Candidatus Bathyarchaeota archaeon]
MISWKHSFKRLNEELEVAKKKKLALDNLLSAGRISQPTYDAFCREIDEAITEIERQQQALREKMNAKAEELENQIKTLEILLANFEIQHVTGEVEEDVYQREVDLLSIGLDNTRRELESVKDAVNQLSGNMPMQSEIEVELPKGGLSKTEVEVIEVTTAPVDEKTSESIVSPLQSAEDAEASEDHGEEST